MIIVIMKINSTTTILPVLPKNSLNNEQLLFTLYIGIVSYNLTKKTFL